MKRSYSLVGPASSGEGRLFTGSVIELSARVDRVDLAVCARPTSPFLALWKDADPDIPILQQAKAEYAKLK
jgi:hypothetical protein